MIDNIEQKLQFSVFQVLPKGSLPDNFTELLSQDKSAEELNESLSEATREEIKLFGVSSPVDNITATLKLGTLLFDLYKTNVETPKAPLMKVLEEKRQREFAAILTSATFDAPPEVIKAAREVLSSEDKWKKVVAWPYVELVDGNNYFFPINHNGVNFYTEILSAACNLVL